MRDTSCFHRCTVLEASASSDLEREELPLSAVDGQGPHRGLIERVAITAPEAKPRQKIRIVSLDLDESSILDAIQPRFRGIQITMHLSHGSPNSIQMFEPIRLSAV